MPETIRIEEADFVVVASGNGAARVAIADALGGLVGALVIGGRQRLFRNAAIPFARRLSGTAVARDATGRAAPTTYVDHADVGLGDQCLLTVGADRCGGVDLVDHGVAWPQRPAAKAGDPGVRTEVGRDARGPYAETTWTIRGGAIACTFVRRLTPHDDGSIDARFALVNDGAAPLPRFWSSHDMVPLDDGTTFALPEGTPLVVYAALGFDAAKDGHAWPLLRRADGSTLDVSSPARAQAALGRPFAAKIFSRDPCGALIVDDGHGAFSLSGDGTRAGLWINRGGWKPATQPAHATYRSACPERCIGGATDEVSQGDGATIAPGASTAWALRYAPL